MPVLPTDSKPALPNKLLGFFFNSNVDNTDLKNSGLVEVIVKSRGCETKFNTHFLTIIDKGML